MEVEVNRGPIGVKRLVRLYFNFGYLDGNISASRNKSGPRLIAGACLTVFPPGSRGYFKNCKRRVLGFQHMKVAVGLFRVEVGVIAVGVFVFFCIGLNLSSERSVLCGQQIFFGIAGDCLVANKGVPFSTWRGDRIVFFIGFGSVRRVSPFVDFETTYLTSTQVTTG